MEAEQRAAVITEAHSWIGTPYAHRQRLKGVAVDCAQLPLAVYEATGVLPPTDVGEYPAQWHLHRSEERYLGWLERLASPIRQDQLRPGDFLVYRFGRAYSHGAILVQDGLVVHAYARARGVTLDDPNHHEDLRDRERLAFTFWRC
jgi:cell wall-associated NlpC family hydrolase